MREGLKLTQQVSWFRRRTMRGMRCGFIVLFGWVCLPCLADQTNLASVANTNIPYFPADFSATDRVVNVPPDMDAESIEARTNDFSVDGLRKRLAFARYLAASLQPEKAETIYVSLLSDKIPDAIRQPALLELASAVRLEGDLPRAETIYAQFLEHWPNDIRVPEVLLHQGRIFRQMALNDMALAKFYGVMTAALSLQHDQLAYYERLVSQAQMEIAETHYLVGKYSDAAEYYSRLLKKSDVGPDRALIQYRIIRCLMNVGRNDEAAAQARDFVARFPNSEEEPEVRYDMAQALKASGQTQEALKQVLLFLQEQQVKTRNHPDQWTYWQQRVGNEIGNQLYREGDYVKALEVYLNLAQLDPSPVWQIPVNYQMGITYERLMQPQQAMDVYNKILAHEPELATNASPGIKAVFEMARWRLNFIGWQTRAQQDALTFALAAENQNTNLAKPAIP